MQPLCILLVSSLTGPCGTHRPGHMLGREGRFLSSERLRLPLRRGMVDVIAKLQAAARKAQENAARLEAGGAADGEDADGDATAVDEEAEEAEAAELAAVAEEEAAEEDVADLTAGAGPASAPAAAQPDGATVCPCTSL